MSLRRSERPAVVAALMAALVVAPRQASGQGSGDSIIDQYQQLALDKAGALAKEGRITGGR